MSKELQIVPSMTVQMCTGVGRTVSVPDTGAAAMRPLPVRACTGVGRTVSTPDTGVFIRNRACRTTARITVIREGYLDVPLALPRQRSTDGAGSTDRAASTDRAPTPPPADTLRLAYPFGDVPSPPASPPASPPDGPLRSLVNSRRGVPILAGAVLIALGLSLSAVVSMTGPRSETAGGAADVSARPVVEAPTPAVVPPAQPVAPAPPPPATAAEPRQKAAPSPRPAPSRKERTPPERAEEQEIPSEMRRLVELAEAWQRAERGNR